MSDLEPQRTIFGVPVEQEGVFNGRPVYKFSVKFPASEEFLIDAGLMDPPPIDPERRRRWEREARRRAVAYAVAKPLDWLSRGAAWLHVEAINAGLWAVGDRSRVAHDEPADEDDY
jgi:hypothetical protein